MPILSCRSRTPNTLEISGDYNHLFDYANVAVNVAWLLTRLVLGAPRSGH